MGTHFWLSSLHDEVSHVCGYNWGHRSPHLPSSLPPLSSCKAVLTHSGPGTPQVLSQLLFLCCLPTSIDSRCRWHQTLEDFSPFSPPLGPPDNTTPSIPRVLFHSVPRLFSSGTRRWAVFRDKVGTICCGHSLFHCALLAKLYASLGSFLWESQLLQVGTVLLQAPPSSSDIFRRDQINLNPSRAHNGA